MNYHEKGFSEDDQLLPYMEPWDVLYIGLQNFKYFSSVPVLHYLQAVLFIKIWKNFMNILYNTL